MASIHHGQSTLIPLPSSLSMTPSSRMSMSVDTVEQRTSPSDYVLPMALRSQDGGGGNVPPTTQGKSPKKKKLNKKMSSTAGIEVYKVAKNGKLQSRRLVFSRDNRSVLVTTNRIKSIKGLFSAMLSKGGGGGDSAPAKVIGLSTIDHVQPGQMTRRFLLARREAENKSDDHQHLNNPAKTQLLESSDATSLSILFRPSMADRMPAGSLANSVGGSATQDPNSPWLDSLDLVIPSPKDFNFLLSALRDLIDINHQERQYYDRNLLLLQHFWVDMGKELSSSSLLTSSEWITLCHALNVPLPKSQLQALYKDMVKDLTSDDDDNHQSHHDDSSRITSASTVNASQLHEGLPLWIVAELLDDVRHFSSEAAGIKFVAQDPLMRIWQDMLHSDPVPTKLSLSETVTRVPLPSKAERAIPESPTASSDASGGANGSMPLSSMRTDIDSTISSVAFLSFLRSQQKSFKSTLEETLDLLHVLNSQTCVQELAQQYEEDRGNEYGSPPASVFAKDRLTRPRFLSYLLSDANDLMDPEYGIVGSDNMSQPLSHYWINTSHDTYLNHAGQPDEQMYLVALYRGVRCLELDVWDNFDRTKPVVSRFDPSEESDVAISFDFIIEAVRRFIVANPESYPIILNIENHCTLDVKEVMAETLKQQLGLIGVLVMHDSSANPHDPLPSPESLQGKVVVIGKRPRVIHAGATIVNDDFDDENDEFFLEDTTGSLTKSGSYVDSDEEDEVGIVVGFDASGPIRETDPDIVRTLPRRNPQELVELTKKKCALAESHATQTEMNALRAAEQAEKAQVHAEDLIEHAGLTREQVDDIINRYNKPSEVDASRQADMMAPKNETEGVEIQDFFGDTVEEAKMGYTLADAQAINAAEAATRSLHELNNSIDALRQAEQDLEQSYQTEKDLQVSSQRMAADARNKRAHADTASQRVEQVRELLEACRESTSSAENVVVTAMTEAKISEKRASETESRAARVLAAAKADRAKADEETRREEQLEKEAASLHAEYTARGKEVKEARERVTKASNMMSKVKDQVRSIERSSEYRKEIQLNQSGFTHEEKDEIEFDNILAKHAAKVEEKRMCSELIKEASSECTEAENRRKQAQIAFEEKARSWKKQASVASQARRLADRSAHTAEELAEHAEEEREAATLRHVAREKAQRNVEDKGANRESLDAQLAVAIRAAEEASRQAIFTRNEAERLAEESRNYNGPEEMLGLVQQRKAEKQNAALEYEEKLVIQEDAEGRAAEAKRLFETSSEVYSSAMRDVADEVSRANRKKIADRNAISAYNLARVKRQRAEHALELAKLAKSVVAEQESAVSRANEYKSRMDRITETPISLANMSFLHATRPLDWDRSMSLPNTHVYSYPQHATVHMMARDPENIEKMASFTSDHIVRTFPSDKITNKRRDRVNYDPVFQWSLGCQMVSMNLGLCDDHMMKVDGRFRQNGSCGYVLKPGFLCDRNDINLEHDQSWQIDILCGSCLPASERDRRRGGSITSHVNPYVKVTVYEGASASQKKTTEHRTRTVMRNGLNPIWDNNPFRFAVSSPSLSIIVFSVFSKSESSSDAFIGASALPISCMREGYRSVALFDSSHNRSGAHAYASLFVRAQKLSA